MTALRIDRLTLHTGQLGDYDARRLAELVSRALGESDTLPPGTERPKRIDRIATTVDTRAGEPIERIAEVVASAIEAAIIAEGVR